MIGSRTMLGTWNVWGGDIFTLTDMTMLLMTGLAGYGGQYFTNLGLQRETAATGTLATCPKLFGPMCLKWPFSTNPLMPGVLLERSLFWAYGLGGSNQNENATRGGCSRKHCGRARNGRLALFDVAQCQERCSASNGARRKLNKES